MKRNKGFTLVELLAVIVVLAIIMIIAIPSVLDTLSTSRVRSFSIYARKSVTATEKTNAEEELAQKITGKGIYTYSIKDDIGFSSTGSYDGYIVVDNCTQDTKQFYHSTNSLVPFVNNCSPYPQFLDTIDLFPFVIFLPILEFHI
jgi:type IV pilus assembly protein PilA